MHPPLSSAASSAIILPSGLGGLRPSLPRPHVDPAFVFGAPVLLVALAVAKYLLFGFTVLPAITGEYRLYAGERRAPAPAAEGEERSFAFDASGNLTGVVQREADGDDGGGGCVGVLLPALTLNPCTCTTPPAQPAGDGQAAPSTTAQSPQGDGRMTAAKAERLARWEAKALV